MRALNPTEIQAVVGGGRVNITPPKDRKFLKPDFGGEAKPDVQTHLQGAPSSLHCRPSHTMLTL